MMLDEWLPLLIGFGLGLSTAVVILGWLYAESFDEDEEMDDATRYAHGSM